MRYTAEGLSDKRHLNYFVPSWLFDRVWLLGRHKNCSRDCDLEMCMLPDQLLIKKFVGCHNVRVVSLPPRYLPRTLCVYPSGGLADNAVAYCSCHCRSSSYIILVAFVAISRLTRHICGRLQLHISWGLK